jgi:PAS domain S-box-containing protein
MPTKSVKILLLEDSPTDAALIEHELKKAGLDFAIRIVDRENTYLQALREFKPDLILSDHSLPGFDSSEAFEIYQSRNLSIPFILVTGTVSEEFAVESIKKGIADYVLKSNLIRLAPAIRGALQRMESKEKTRLAEERDRRAQRIAKLGSWEWNLVTNIVSWSSEIYSILGLSTGLNPSQELYMEHVCSEDRKLVEQARFSLLGEGVHYSIDYRICCPNGEIRYVNEQGDLQEDLYGGILCFTGSVQDITKRKSVEEQLENERKFLKTVLDTVKVAILVTDKEGNLDIYNDFFRTLHNFPPGGLSEGEWRTHIQVYEADGKTLVPYEQLPTFRALKGEKILNLPLVIHAKNALVRKVIVNAQRMVDEEGRTIGALAAIHDETELRNSEEKLRSKVQELDTFIYKASHDLKGPLSSMAGLINLAKKEITSSAFGQYLDRLEQSNQKMETILHDLLELAHISQGTSTYRQVNLLELTWNVINSLQDLPACRDISFRVNIPEGTDFVSDDKLIRGIMQNLIHNSIKYRRMVSDTFIQIDAHRMADSFAISVSDNGIGIKADMQEQVFKMFFRGHFTSTGSGLGLYIVKNAVDKLKGRIEIESTYGHSTCFRLYFPFTAEMESSKETN